MNRKIMECSKQDNTTYNNHAYREVDNNNISHHMIPVFLLKKKKKNDIIVYSSKLVLSRDFTHDCVHSKCPQCINHSRRLYYIL